ncbi:MAG: ATP-binding cassette domain-containing protein [Bacteroidales bacterium]|jgi:ABC-2 type transport system ATP-binding protein|nr:ATP-binding cassette domain-containing protein [Bacteroidales bacterium]
MSILLKTQKLTKKYKNQFAVDNVNVKINKGDIYGFIGQNGAGKTTFIRLITNIINPTSGSLEYHFTENKPGNISAIVETPSLFTKQTAQENLKAQFILLGKTDFTQIDELLQLVGLDNLLFDNKKKVGNFSLGMKQRLSIAVALASNPEFVVLDEPMNGLDPEGIVAIRELILKLNKEKNITFLISSHILTELSKIATRYGIIHRGKLLKEFNANELDKNQHTEVVVSSTNNLLSAMQNLAVTKYKIIDKTLIINDIEIKNSQIIAELAKNGIDVISINKIGENIEDYFLYLIGEKQNEKLN